MGSLKTRGSSTQAVHLQADANHTVVVDSLRVIICPDGDGWFAQGIEIDYAAYGSSIEAAQLNFERGLAQTIHLHLERFGEIDRLLKFAPTAAWKKLKDPNHYSFTLLTRHTLPETLDALKQTPFSDVAYLQAA